MAPKTRSRSEEESESAAESSASASASASNPATSPISAPASAAHRKAKTLIEKGDFSRQPAFELVRAPVLKSLIRAAVLKFETAYLRYFHHYDANSEFIRQKPLPLDDLLDRKISHHIQDYFLEDGEEMIDKNILRVLKDIIGTREKIPFQEFQRKVAQRLKTDMRIVDGRSPMTDLMEQHAEIVEDLGRTREYFKTNAKDAVTQLINALEPPNFRELMEGDVHDNKELKYDYKKFFRYLCDEAQIFNRHQPHAQKNYSSKSPSVTVSNKPSNSNRSRASAPPAQSSNSYSKPVPPVMGCLKCKGSHWLKNCPEASDYEKDNLKELMDRKVNKNPGKAVIKPANTWTKTYPAESSHSRTVHAISHLPEGCVEGLMADVLKVVMLPDSGAAESIVSIKHIRRLLDLQAAVHLIPLARPYHLNGVSEGSVMKVSQVAKLKVTFPTQVGILTVRNMKVSVVQDESVDMLIVGRPVTEPLGLDMVKHFYNMAEQNVTLDMDEVEEKTSGIIAMLKKDNAENDWDDRASLDDEIVDIGEDAENKITDALASMVTTAKTAGMPEDYANKLSKLISEFRDIWRLRLGADPPVKVPPMEIHLRPDAVPVQCRARRYPPLHREYMKTHIDELLRYGLVFQNGNSSWSSPPLIVPKPNTKTDFRMTIDVCRVNAQTASVTWPMPNLEVVMQSLENSTVYASFDLFKGYWQLPLHKDSQECMSLMTDTGIYTPTRVIQGSTGVVVYCQATVQRILGDQLYKSVLVWLDDILAYTPDLPTLMTVMRSLFSKCHEFGLKLNAKKCVLYTTEVKWCGRLISARGIRQDPARVTAMLDLKPPVLGSDLVQFTCALNWMRMSIPEFALHIAPLQEFLETVYASAGARTKRATAKIQLATVGWSDSHLAAFEKCKTVLAQHCTLTHPSPDKIVCVFTDASLDFWGAAVTQIPPEDIGEPLHQQRHEPLAFLSGSFKNAAARWPIVEKEAFAIVETVCRLEYLLIRPGEFQLFTDHRNLQYLFNPHGHNPTLQRHALARLNRWSIKLMSFEYQIQHVSGEDNVWADLLSRWGADEVPPPPRAIRAFYALVAPSLDASFRLPAVADIVLAQTQHASEAPPLPTIGTDNLHPDGEGRV